MFIRFMFWSVAILILMGAVSVSATATNIMQQIYAQFQYLAGIILIVGAEIIGAILKRK